MQARQYRWDLMRMFAVGILLAIIGIGIIVYTFTFWVPNSSQATGFISIGGPALGGLGTIIPYFLGREPRKKLRFFKEIVWRIDNIEKKGWGKYSKKDYEKYDSLFWQTLGI